MAATWESMVLPDLVAASAIMSSAVMCSQHWQTGPWSRVGTFDLHSLHAASVMCQQSGQDLTVLSPAGPPLQKAPAHVSDRAPAVLDVSYISYGLLPVFLLPP